MNHPLQNQTVGGEILVGLRYDGTMMDVWYQFTEMRRGAASFGASFYVKVADFTFGALGEKRAAKLKEFESPETLAQLAARYKLMKPNQYQIGQTVQVKMSGELVNATYAGWSDRYKMPLVEVDGKQYPRKIHALGGARVHNAPAVKQSRFDVNTRFEFINEVTRMVVGGESNSVIITGSGGLGKTFTVMACLKEAGMVEADEPAGEDADFSQDAEPTPAAKQYEVVKGFVTPKALYRLLYNNRDRLVIFDDCDSVWDNPTTVSLLKAALDSYETRNISWFSENCDEEDLPQRFEFKGKIIFVSNLQLTDLDQAVLSRCLYVDVSMTAVEKIERIKTLKPVIRPDMSNKMKDECIAVLEENAENIGDLNIRTMLKVCEIRHNNKPNWRDLAEYVITAL